MIKGQRPTRHWRRVKTKTGAKPRLINPTILRTDDKGYLPTLQVVLVGQREPTISLPAITVKRLGDYGARNRAENITLIKSIYAGATESEMNVPTDADFTRDRERYYFILKRNFSMPVGVGAVRLRNGEIQKIFILPEHRGHKYGLAFVREMEKVLSATNRNSKAIMFVKRDNTRAQRIWERMGYTNTGEFGDNNSVRFEKRLRTSSAPTQRIMTTI